MENKGIIRQVIGPVVDVAFDEKNMPEIYQALRVSYEVDGEPQSVVLEVQQHLGEGMVRAVAMSSTEGLVRGLEAVDTGDAITVPVGRGVLGRIFNVTGDPVDERGEVPTDKRSRIHREAPPLMSRAWRRRSSRRGSRSST